MDMNMHMRENCCLMAAWTGLEAAQRTPIFAGGYDWDTTKHEYGTI